MSKDQNALLIYDPAKQKMSTHTKRRWGVSWRADKYHYVTESGRSLCGRIKDGFEPMKFEFADVDFLYCKHCRNKEVKLLDIPPISKLRRVKP